MNTARNALRRLAVGGAFVAVATAPLCFVVPAEATTSDSGCSVTPVKPYVTGIDKSGVKLVRYDIRISCDANRSIQVQHQYWEEDFNDNADEFIGSRTFTRTFDAAGSLTTGATRRLPDTEDSKEEMYQRARFRVTSNGVTSAKTSYERTKYRAIQN
jgi:hypothetical protein